MNRVNVERSIYQLPGSKEYVVVSYSKESKKTATLFRSSSLEEARTYRDTNLRFAEYGKGIQRIKNRYTAAVIALSKSKHYNIHIGTFDTAEEARQARINYIEKLK